MLVAAVAAHVLSAVNRKRPAEQRSNLMALAGIGVPFALLVIGILLLQRPLL
jgi:hypothetical protein